MYKYGHSFTDTTLKDVVDAVTDRNILLSATAKGAEMSLSKCTKVFIERNYPIAMPLQ